MSLGMSGPDRYQPSVRNRTTVVNTTRATAPKPAAKPYRNIYNTASYNTAPQQTVKPIVGAAQVLNSMPQPVRSTQIAPQPVARPVQQPVPQPVQQPVPQPKPLVPAQNPYSALASNPGVNPAATDLTGAAFKPGITAQQPLPAPTQPQPIDTYTNPGQNLFGAPAAAPVPQPIVGAGSVLNQMGTFDVNQAGINPAPGGTIPLMAQTGQIPGNNMGTFDVNQAGIMPAVAGPVAPTDLSQFDPALNPIDILLAKAYTLPIPQTPGISQGNPFTHVY